jgi:D-alanyl-D-alanine carboxypeptidase/D-alanyl-D-alanine-endopeptidase (penicillin-binding protein 4)
MPDRRPGVLWLTLGLVISLLLSTGIGYFATGGAHGAYQRRAQAGIWGAMIPVTPRFKDPAPALAPDSAGGAAATSNGIATALAPLLNDPRFGGKLGVSVVDVETGDQLYGQRVDIPVTPASTTKIVTAAAVLAARGPYHRFTTRVVTGASKGQVVLIGGGDPTLAAGPEGSYPGAARLDVLAKQVKAAGTEVTSVVVDSSLFSGPALGVGWDSDVVAPGKYGAPVNALTMNGGRVTPTPATERSPARTATPDLFTGAAFAKLLGLPASAVSSGTADPAAKELGKLQSPPLQHLVELMLQLSDNVIAESLLRQVAIAKGQPATFEGGQLAVKAILTELGLDPAGHALLDGSGLSRQNRITPALLTAILHATTEPSHGKMRGVLAGLPVAAYSGTLEDRFAGAPAQSAIGEVRAKTGTLTGVSALSGVVVAENGHQLAFAAITDGVPPNGGSNAEAGLDQIAATLASCGCS